MMDMGRIQVEFLKSCPGMKHLPTDGLPEIALVGRSNVGKSSLLNRLAKGKNTARTSSKPGCTQFLNLYKTDKGYYLLDLPGYGYAKAPKKERKKWVDWIGEYIMERKPLRGIVLLVDARHPDMVADIEMAELLRELGRPYIIALTKADKLKRGKLTQAVHKAEEMGPVIPVSSVTGAGFDKLGSWLASATVD